MAEVIGLKTEIDIGESAKSLKTLKAEFKELQVELDKVAAGSKEATSIMQKMADVKDEMDDLNESVSALTGGGKFQAIANVGTTIAAGFQAAQGAMALFGAESSEVEQALLKVQAASALAAGFKELEGLGDALNNAKAAAKGLFQTLMANPVLAIAAAVTTLVIAFAAFRDKLIESQDPLKAMRERFDALKKSTEQLTTQYDIQITSLSGLKKNEEEILVLQKRKLELQLMLKIEAAKIAKAEAEQSIQRLSASSKELSLLEKGVGLITGISNVRDAGKQKILEEAQARQKNAEAATLELQTAEAQLKAFNNGLEQKKIDKQAEYNEKHKEEIEHRKFLDTINAAGGAQDISIKQQQINLQSAVNEELQKTITINAELARAEELASLRKQLDEEKNSFIKIGIITKIAQIEKEIAAEKDKLREEDLKKDLEAANKKLGHAESFHNSLSNLNDAFNAFQKSGLKEGEKLSIQQQKAAFNREKALNIAGALMNGGKSVTQIMASTPAPVWPFLISAAAATTALQVAAIARQKFTPEGGSSGEGAGGGVAMPNIGSFNQLNNTPQQTSTQLNDDGSVKKEMSIKAHVVANEMTAQQEVEKKIQNNNMFE